MSIPKVQLDSQRGFTLVEILVAMAILGFAILGITWGEQQKWRVLSRGSRSSEAIRMIEQRIEMKRIGVLTTKTLPASGTITSETRNGIKIRDSVGVARDIFNAEVPNVRVLTLWATWPGSKDTLRIQTHIAKDF